MKSKVQQQQDWHRFVDVGLSNTKSYIADCDSLAINDDS